MSLKVDTSFNKTNAFQIHIKNEPTKQKQQGCQILPWFHRIMVLGMWKRQRKKFTSFSVYAALTHPYLLGKSFLLYDPKKHLFYQWGLEPPFISSLHLRVVFLQHLLGSLVTESFCGRLMADSPVLIFLEQGLFYVPHNQWILCRSVIISYSLEFWESSYH